MQFSSAFLLVLSAASTNIAAPTGPTDADTGQAWEDVAGKPGALTVCDFYNFQGVCDVTYRPADEGRCFAFQPEVAKQIESAKVGNGGQCTFWAEVGCKGRRRLTLNTNKGRTDYPNLRVFDWAGVAMSYACWGRTDCIKGTNCDAPKVVPGVSP